MSISIYFYLVIVVFLFFILRFRKYPLGILIILIFFHGLFQEYGKTVDNYYRIFISLYATYLFLKYNAYKYIKKNDTPLILFFFLFTINFYFTGVINGDPTKMLLSQYFSKFYLVIVSFFIFKTIYIRFSYQFEKILTLILYIIYVQGIFSIIKFFIYGGFKEGIVGTISSVGGATATTFSILAIIVVWFFKKGKISITSLFPLLLIIFIGFSSMKRALIIILPIVLFLLQTYLQGRKLNIRYLVIFPIILLIFYLGVRLNPSLNPEKKLWGTFNLSYAIEYSAKYSLGEVQYGKLSHGRMSSSFYLLNEILYSKWDQSYLFGIGHTVFRSTSYEEFLTYDTGLNTKAAMNGLYKTFFSTGLIGIFLFIAYYFNILKKASNIRFRRIIIGIVAWDYFFYHGTTTDNVVMMFFLIFLIWYSNYFFLKRTAKNHINI